MIFTKEDNEWKALDKYERAKVDALNDPLVNIIWINGWRRFELAQAIISYDGGKYAYFRRKKRQEIERQLLTSKEISLLNELKSGYFKDTKPTQTAMNKAINRKFNKIAEDLGFDEFFPHRMRATFATGLSRYNVPAKTLQKAGGWKSAASMNGYIQPEEEEVFEAKQLNTKLRTIDGMTMPELKAEIYKGIQRINRVEEDAKYWRQQFLALKEGGSSERKS